MKQILTPEAFEAINQSSIFDKAGFCLGEKQGMLVNNEYSSWYNGVGDFLMSVLGENIFHMAMDWFNRNHPTPECQVNGTECYDG